MASPTEENNGISRPSITSPSDLELFVSRNNTSPLAQDRWKRGISAEEYFVMVQNEYCRALDTEDFAKIRLMMEFTGIVPDQDFFHHVNETYRKLAEEGESKKIVELWEATGMPPRFYHINYAKGVDPRGIYLEKHISPNTRK